MAGSARAGTAGNSSPSLDWERFFDSQSLPSLAGPALPRVRRGEKWKIRFSSEALGRAGRGGFEAQQPLAKRSGLRGNILANI